MKEFIYIMFNSNSNRLTSLKVSGKNAPTVLRSVFCQTTGIKPRFVPEFTFTEGITHFAEKRGYYIKAHEL